MDTSVADRSTPEFFDENWACPGDENSTLEIGWSNSNNIRSDTTPNLGMDGNLHLCI